MNISSPSTLNSKSAVVALSLGILMSSVSVAQTIIVSENFGGLNADPLNGTTADTFSSAIATAGGSSTWSAFSSYNADGSVTSNGAAFLDLGSYVNATKGTATGLFTLSVTMDQPTGSSWLSYGFLVDGATAEIGTNFTTVNSAATIIYRTSGSVDGFAGLQTGGPVEGSTLDAGGSFTPSATDQLLTTVLDLRDWDGTSNFGTVSFYGGDDSAGNLLGSNSIGADMDFAKLGLTATGLSSGNVSSLSLSQVPEPSALLLSGLSLLALLRRRR